MRRATSYLALTAACIAAGWAGLQLAIVVTMSPEKPMAAMPPSEAISPAPVVAPLSEGAPLAFLPIFGVPEPRPALQAEPQNAASATRNYILTGVIASGATRWAFIQGTGATETLREGDRLSDGTTVARIAADGVELASGDETIVLAFEAAAIRPPKQASVSVAEAPTHAGKSREPIRQMVRSVEMDRNDVLALVDAALDRARPN